MFLRWWLEFQPPTDGINKEHNMCEEDEFGRSVDKTITEAKR